MRYVFPASVLGLAAAFAPLYCFSLLFAVLLGYDVYVKSRAEKWLSLAAGTHFAMWFIAVQAAERFWLAEYPASTATCLYLLTLAVYHSGEHLCTAYFHEGKSTWHSFLLDQSWHYGLAMAVSFAELGVRLYFGLYLQAVWEVSFVLGGICVGVGQALRIGSEINAGANFTHVISYEKQDSHHLVTSGLYTLCRHPSYFGWFLWSVGTQVMVCNPVCVVLYFYASRSFFTDRIDNEETTLQHFFRRDYVEYMKRVPAFPKGFQWMLGTVE